MSKVISFESRVGKVQTGQTSGGFTAIKPLNNHSLFLFFYSFFIIYSLQLFSSTYLSILFDFSTSSLSLSLSLCFVFLIRNKEVSAWNFSIFWAIFMSFFSCTIFSLHSLGFLGVPVQVCVCITFIYIQGRTHVGAGGPFPPPPQKNFEKNSIKKLRFSLLYIYIYIFVSPPLKYLDIDL